MILERIDCMTRNDEVHEFGRIKYNVCFRLICDELDPSEITALLGIIPSRAHRKGDPNTSVSKKGKITYFSPFNTGLWSLHSRLKESADLEHHVVSLLTLLYPLKSKLVELSQRGYKMDMFCGAFLHESSQPGFDLSADVLLQMGELNISFGLCMYP